jgi:hypothetical protein
MEIVHRIVAPGILGALLTVAANAALAGPPMPPLGYTWQPIAELTDEFNGTSLDTNKWLNYHPYWSGRGSTFDPANVSLGNGGLALQSTATTVTNIRAACVSSKTKAAASGCYYEASVMASKLSMTSSFWFQGSYSEIDVTETLGASLRNPGGNLLMPMNTHYFTNGWGSDIYTSRQWNMPTGCEAEFHTYGVWWRDSRNLTMYHNGTAVADISPGGDFLESQYMFFDTEVFSWEGTPTLASLQDPTRNTMYVDWVRAWKLVPVATNSPSLTASVSNGNLLVSWPQDHVGWTLQVRTNSQPAGPGTNWSPMINSRTTNLMVDPIDRNSGSTFYRLEYP